MWCSTDTFILRWGAVQLPVGLQGSYIALRAHLSTLKTKATAELHMTRQLLGMDGHTLLRSSISAFSSVFMAYLHTHP